MRRITTVIAPLILISMLIYVVVQALASDDSRIRSRIESLAVAFNDRNLGNFVEAFDKAYHDETMRELDRRRLKQALQYVFLTKMEKREGFAMRLKVPEDRLEVSIEASGDEALVDFDGILEERSAGEWDLLWHVRVESKMHKVDGDWLIYQTTHSTIEGRRPR